MYGFLKKKTAVKILFSMLVSLTGSQAQLESKVFYLAQQTKTKPPNVLTGAADVQYPLLILGAKLEEITMNRLKGSLTIGIAQKVFISIDACIRMPMNGYKSSLYGDWSICDKKVEDIMIKNCTKELNTAVPNTKTLTRFSPSFGWRIK